VAHARRVVRLRIIDARQRVRLLCAVPFHENRRSQRHTTPRPFRQARVVRVWRSLHQEPRRDDPENSASQSTAASLALEFELVVRVTGGISATLHFSPTICPDRVLRLLGKIGGIDYPRLDPPVALNGRKDHLAHLGQNLFVRSARVTDELQERRMPRRSRVRLPRTFVLVRDRVRLTASVDRRVVLETFAEFTCLF
jgi:hypothetical protein